MVDLFSINWQWFHQSQNQGQTECNNYEWFHLSWPIILNTMYLLNIYFIFCCVSHNHGSKEILSASSCCRYYNFTVNRVKLLIQFYLTLTFANVKLWRGLLIFWNEKKVIWNYKCFRWIDIGRLSVFQLLFVNVNCSCYCFHFVVKLFFLLLFSRVKLFKSHPLIRWTLGSCLKVDLYDMFQHLSGSYTGTHFFCLQIQ